MNINEVSSRAAFFFINKSYLRPVYLNYGFKFRDFSVTCINNAGNKYDIKMIRYMENVINDTNKVSP